MRLRLVAVVALLVTAGPAPAARFDRDTVYDVPVGDSPSRGPRTAPITIVEFSDFRCGYCARARYAVDELFRLYPGQVRLVYKFRPLDLDVDSESVLAAEAALSAGAQGQFWPMHDRLFQPDAVITRAALDGYARELGLDVAQFRQDLDDGVHRRAIGRDLELVDRLGVGGTPMFFINGRPIVGAQPLGEFIRVMDDELKRAQGALRSGVAPEDLYAHLIRGGEQAGGPEVRRGLDPARTYPVGLGDNGHVRGKADALVTLVVFEDFECGYCARLVPTLDRLAAAYGAELRIVYRHFPLSFHPHAQLAAEAALAAAAQGKFWQMHDVLFANQGALERADLERYAEQVGLNMTKFRRALDDRTYAAAVEADIAAGAELGVTGTPTVFVNGSPIVGAQPIDVFRAMIDARLMQARELVDGGLPRGEVYKTVTGAP